MSTATIAPSLDQWVAPEVQQLLDLGEMSVEMVQDNTRLSLLLVDFVTRIAQRPEVIAMFEANDRTHFIEGMRAKGSWLGDRFAEYLYSLRATNHMNRTHEGENQ